MSRVPSLPYRVLVTKKKVGDAAPQLEQHSYSSLAGAIVYRDIALRRPNTFKVETVMVLDETTPAQVQVEPQRQIRSFRA